MKKILTIVGLAMLLCLAVSVALAGTDTDPAAYTEAQIELFASEGYLPDSTAIYGTNLAEVKLASGHNEEAVVKLYTNAAQTEFKPVTVLVNPHVAGNTLKNATCVEAGNKKCKECGVTMVGVIPKLTGHAAYYEYRTVDDPTCDDYGKARLYCTLCKVWIPDSEAEVDPTHAHTWITKIVQMPTCKVPGKSEIACKYCGINKSVYENGYFAYDDASLTVAEFNADAYLVNANGGRTIDGHAWVNWVDSTPATCLKNKTQIRWCSICELKQEREVPFTQLAPVWSCDVDPTTITCQATNADVTWTCSICKGANPAHKQQLGFGPDAYGKFDSPDKKVSVKANHIFDLDDTASYEKEADGVTVKVYKVGNRIGKAKCLEGDYKRVKCQKCDTYKKVYVTAALGHDWTDWQLIAAPGASGNVDGLWNRTCKRCGETVSYTGPKQPSDLCEEHEPVLDEDNSYAPTCEDEGYACYVCELCGIALPELDEVLPALGHDYKVVAEVAATCTTAGKGIKVCTVCNDVVRDVVIEKLGHKFGEWTVTKEATTEAEGEETRECERCGEKETRKIAKLDKEAKYDVEGLKYNNPVATGSVKLEEGTKALENAYARVTFFLANGDCMIQIVEVAEDGTFKAGAIGNFVHISVVIVDVDDAYGADEAIEHAHGNAGIKL